MFQIDEAPPKIIEPVHGTEIAMPVVEAAEKKKQSEGKYNHTPSPFADQVDPKLIALYFSNRFFSVRYKFAMLLSPSLSRNKQKGTLSVSLCFITHSTHFL